jgi:alpha-beta hydrolase superfamily lysophospholipase
MDHGEATFQAARGIDLYYQSWQPDDRIRAILIIVPGVGGHSGVYGHLVEQLVPKNYAIYSFDLRGNGRSPGQRGYIHSWAEFREDLRAFVQFIQRQFPDRPLFLMGHSLGAVVVLDYLLHFPAEAETVQGAIALAPALGKVGVSPLKAFLARMLSRVLPRFSLHTKIDPGTASRDPAVVAANIQDPLRHDWVSARLATEFFATVEWVQHHAAELNIPLLLLHGGADQVALPAGSRHFFQQVLLADKEYQEYPGAYHELQDDLEYLKVIADLEQWLEKHLGMRID